MRKGLTPAADAIFDKVAGMECILPYTLCGGTALAIQLEHRQSEDLDFMAWRISKDEKPEVDWPAISKELESKVGRIDNMDLLGFDQVTFTVSGVKISFYVSENFAPRNLNAQAYLGNIRLASMDAILAMKLEVMLRRMKFRDYYDVYSILKAGAKIQNGIEAAIQYSQHRLKTKNIVSMLLSGRFYEDRNFAQLEPRYQVTELQMREYILSKLKEI